MTAVFWLSDSFTPILAMSTILDKNCGKKEKSHILCSFSAPPT